MSSNNGHFVEHLGNRESKDAQLSVGDIDESNACMEYDQNPVRRKKVITCQRNGQTEQKL